MIKNSIKILITYLITSIISVLLTVLAWDNVFNENYKNVVPNFIRFFLSYLGMWPSFILENGFGFNITNKSTGIIPNLIGWILLITLIFVIKRQILKSLKKRN